MFNNCITESYNCYQRQNLDINQSVSSFYPLRYSAKPLSYIS